MADEGDRRQAKFSDLLEVELVDGSAGRARFDRVQQHVFARGEVRPNSFRFGWRRFYRRGAADAGMIAPNDREDLDAAHVARLQDATGGADVGKNAALARRHDHKLEILGPLLVDAARERRGEVHFTRSRTYGSVRIGDRLVGDARQPPQNTDLLGCLDFAQSRQHGLCCREPRLWQQLAQGGQIAGREVIHLDADARLP